MNEEEGIISSIDMTPKEMEMFLIDLYSTQYWQAIKRYIDARRKLVEDSLMTIDPFQHPTSMAKNQGIRLGLIDLEGAIIEAIDKRKKKENEQNQK